MIYLTKIPQFWWWFGGWAILATLLVLILVAVFKRNKQLDLLAGGELPVGVQYTKSVKKENSSLTLTAEDKDFMDNYYDFTGFSKK